MTGAGDGPKFTSAHGEPEKIGWDAGEDPTEGTHNTRFGLTPFEAFAEDLANIGKLRTALERVATGTHNTSFGSFTTTGRVTDTCTNCGGKYEHEVAVSVVDGEVVYPAAGYVTSCPACRGQPAIR